MAGHGGQPEPSPTCPGWGLRTPSPGIRAIRNQPGRQVPAAPGEAGNSPPYRPPPAPERGCGRSVRKGSPFVRKGSPFFRARALRRRGGGRIPLPPLPIRAKNRPDPPKFGSPTPSSTTESSRRRDRDPKEPLRDAPHPWPPRGSRRREVTRRLGHRRCRGGSARFSAAAQAPYFSASKRL